MDVARGWRRIHGGPASDARGGLRPVAAPASAAPAPALATADGQVAVAVVAFALSAWGAAATERAPPHGLLPIVTPSWSMSFDLFAPSWLAANSLAIAMAATVRLEVLAVFEAFVIDSPLHASIRGSPASSAVVAVIAAVVAPAVVVVAASPAVAVAGPAAAAAATSPPDQAAALRQAACCEP